MGKPESIRPSGHVIVPAAAIGALSVILAAGLQALHTLDRVNDFIGGMLAKGAAGTSLITLPAWMIWLPGIAIAFVLPLVILNVPGTWRRVVLWITSAALAGGWAPVLYLSARSPDVASPLVITIWSGVCALVYAGNHRMPCEESSPGPEAEPSPNQP